LKKSFTIPRTDESDENPSSLLPALVEATGSETDAASVLRSVQRLGTDPSILFYEMTMETRGPRGGGVSTHAWRVRADRGEPKIAEQPEDSPGTSQEPMQE